MSFEPIAETSLAWNHDAQTGVVDLQVTGVRWETQALLQRVRRTIGANLFDLHRRRQRISAKTLRVDHLDDACIGEPQPPIRAQRSSRKEIAKRGLCSIERIEYAKNHARR